MKQAPTIYNKAIDDAIARRSGGEVPFGTIMIEFMRAGFTEKKAKQRIEEMAKLNGHKIVNGMIKYV